MKDLLLALGSNMGDRERNIDAALARLDGVFGERLAFSGLMLTEAVGFDGAPFMNAVVKYRSSLSPENVLDICKDIERRMGRTDREEYDPQGNRIYHDRVMDIDILDYGGIRMKTSRLTLPHPQIETRAYVKELLKRIG